MKMIRFDRTAMRTGRTGLLGLTSTLFMGGSRLLTNILLGRLGGPELLGIAQGVLSTASLTTLLLPSSAGSAASKYISFYKAQGDINAAKSVARHIGIRVVQATFLLAVAVVAIGSALGINEAAIVAVTLFLMLGMCGQAFIRGVHYGTNEVTRLVRWDVMVSVSSFVAVLILLIGGVRNVWVLTPLAFVSLVFVFVSWPYGKSTKAAKGLRREIDHFMLLGVVGTVSSSGFLQSSILVAAAAGGLQYAGKYSAALALTTPVSLVAAAVSLALFPAMAGDHGRGDPRSLHRRTSNSTSVLATVMVGIFGVLSFMAEPITTVVWGREFYGAGDILIVLLLALVLITIAVPSVNSLTTESNRGMIISAVSSLSGFGVGVAAWVTLRDLIPQHVVPVGYLLGACVIAAVPYGVTWKRHRHAWFGQTVLIVSALMVIVGTVVALRISEAPVWAQGMVALVFTALWVSIRAEDVKMIARLVRSVAGTRISQSPHA